MLALALGGCATFSEDGGFGAVEATAQARTGERARWLKDDAAAAAAAAEVNRRLAAPLTAEATVHIALLNNRGLQAAYAELGIAEAERVQAGRWINPGFSFGKLTRADEIEIERALLFDLMALITMPRRVEIATQAFERAQLVAAARTVDTAAAARRAWIDAVAALEHERYFAQVMVSAEASAELARRMAAVGNFSALQRMRQQAFYADAATGLARAQQAAVAARERLARVLGIDDSSRIRLPGRLPDLPESARTDAGLEAQALRERLDLKIAKTDAEQQAKSLGLTDATRFVNVLELKLMRNTESPKPPQKGWEIELRLPLFDPGDAKLSAAQHRYLRSVNQLAQLAVDARSEVREAYAAYRTAYDVARHLRDEVVPLRKRISEEALLRYNGMLLGVFELLADARESIASVNAALGAQREFWLADANLQAALTGRPAGALPAAEVAATLPAGAAGAGH